MTKITGVRNETVGVRVDGSFYEGVRGLAHAASTKVDLPKHKWMTKMQDGGCGQG